MESKCRAQRGGVGGGWQRRSKTGRREGLREKSRGSERQGTVTYAFFLGSDDPLVVGSVSAAQDWPRASAVHGQEGSRHTGRPCSGGRAR